MHQSTRPQTSREAKAAYNKRHAKTYMSKEEHQRLHREEQREERRLEILRKEAARKEAARKRAEKESKQREKRRRMGISNPEVKLSPGQLKIGNFLRTNDGTSSGVERDRAKAYTGHNRNQRDQQVESLRPDEQEDTITHRKVPRLVTFHEVRNTHPVDQHIADFEDSCHPRPNVKPLQERSSMSPERPEAIQKVEDQPQAVLGAHPSPNLPPVDLTSSFFVSNSQLDRELNSLDRTDPIDHDTWRDHETTEKIVVAGAQVEWPLKWREPSTAVVEAPAVRINVGPEFQSFFDAIPSSELDCI